MRGRMERCFARHPNRTNPYARALLLRRIVRRTGAPEATADPPRSTPTRRPTSRASRPAASTGFALSNILDGASAEYERRLIAAVKRAAAKDAVVGAPQLSRAADRGCRPIAPPTIARCCGASWTCGMQWDGGDADPVSPDGGSGAQAFGIDPDADGVCRVARTGVERTDVLRADRRAAAVAPSPAPAGADRDRDNRKPNVGDGGELLVRGRTPAQAHQPRSTRSDTMDSTSSSRRSRSAGGLTLSGGGYTLRELPGGARRSPSRRDTSAAGAPAGSGSRSRPPSATCSTVTCSAAMRRKVEIGLNCHGRCKQRGSRRAERPAWPGTDQVRVKGGLYPLSRTRSWHRQKI